MNPSAGSVAPRAVPPGVAPLRVGRAVPPVDGSSIVEVVCRASGLEVYERAGEGVVDALERRLRRLGLRLVVRRRAMCG